MKEFFSLTAQAVKLSSPYMEGISLSSNLILIVILNLPIKQMYNIVNTSNIPFYKWAQWIDEYLHKTILSKIYAEAFQNQMQNSRKQNQFVRRQTLTKSCKCF